MASWAAGRTTDVRGVAGGSPLRPGWLGCGQDRWTAPPTTHLPSGRMSAGPAVGPARRPSRPRGRFSAWSAAPAHARQGVARLLPTGLRLPAGQCPHPAALRAGCRPPPLPPLPRGGPIAAGSNQQQPSQQDQPRQGLASASCSTPKQAHPRRSQPSRVRGGFGMSRSFSQLCVPGPDGSQRCHPIAVPTWIVNGGTPPPDNDQRWVDVQTLPVVDAWAGQINERGSPDAPGGSLGQGDGRAEQAAAGGDGAERAGPS
jgi:hypothetical protein